MPHIHELYDFTASAYILHPHEAKICLHYHKKLHSWLQPGGHIELNEDPIEALAHELREEVGLEPDQYELLGPETISQIRGSKVLPVPALMNVHPYDNIHKHIDYGYVVRAKTEVLQPQEGESVKIGWFHIDDIASMHRRGELLDGTFDICNWVLKTYV